ncbi:hypothetical protein HanRHA438_Chr17g0790071 [Helianthus annuus]|nr:hypothetical protein HanRHA438_Chr17g0790071 [Helianthus annuus]
MRVKWSFPLKSFNSSFISHTNHQHKIISLQSIKLGFLQHKITHNFPHLINRNRHRLFLLPNRKLGVPHQLFNFIPQLIHQHLNIIQILDHNPIPNPH